MIVDRNVELAERLGSRKAVASFALRQVWEFALVAVCVAILVVVAIAMLEGVELG